MITKPGLCVCAFFFFFADKKDFSWICKLSKRVIRFLANIWSLASLCKYMGWTICGLLLGQSLLYKIIWRKGSPCVCVRAQQRTQGFSRRGNFSPKSPATTCLHISTSKNTYANRICFVPYTGLLSTARCCLQSQTTTIPTKEAVYDLNGKEAITMMMLKE